MNTNPFSKQDTDRRAIWEMLVYRDIKAFLRADWGAIVEDFEENSFLGINANGIENQDAWNLAFPTLDTYKEDWLRQAQEFQTTDWGENAEAALFRVTVLRDIEISGDTALAHKKFFGHILKADGCYIPMNFQTLYYCRKKNNRWKIIGFTGYLPHVSTPQKTAAALIKYPSGARQHKTAGPYSPVLEIRQGNLVVISGQSAIDGEGNVIGTTIEEQTSYTMDNCRKQLATAGCELKDVFKVNIYMEDLKNWARFNEIYKQYFIEPLPVRATVQTGLLMNLLIEIEMWAVKS